MTKIKKLLITLHAYSWYQNLLENMYMQGRSFTRLLALRYVGFCNALYIWSVRAILTLESIDSMIH